MFRKSVVLTLCVGLLALAGMASAAVSTPSIFGDHMVLQQGKTVPVWGKAAPGEDVTVSFAGQQARAKACSAGRWKVDLKPLKAGVTGELTIAGKDNTLKYADVLVGEVWIGSGQSNMQWDVQNSNNAEAEIKAANYPQVRLFSVERSVAGEPQYDCKGQWTVCSPNTIPGFSAVLYFFGRDLHRELKRPVGLINTSWGGTPAESWASRRGLEAVPELKSILDFWDKTLAEYPQAERKYKEALAQWEKDAAQAKADGKPEPSKPNPPLGPDHPYRAAGLYNAMIAPLVPYAIAGAIWYQGESNAGRAYEYRTLFPAMIEGWHRAWNQGPFPFLFVQLANFMARQPEPGESAWAELREAQTMALRVKNAGMAVIIDIGDAQDIHPRNKQDVGKRLGLIALAQTYGKSVEWSGPVYKSMKIKDGKAVLQFTHADGLVAKGGALKGFAIAGPDKKFVWADATIKGRSIVVSSDKVSDPVAVRYAWADNPEATLYNAAGLPASPFRTDTWPGVTVDSHLGSAK